MGLNDRWRLPIQQRHNPYGLVRLRCEDKPEIIADPQVVEWCLRVADEPFGRERADAAIAPEKVQDIPKAVAETIEVRLCRRRQQDLAPIEGVHAVELRLW